MPNSKNF